MALRPLLSYLSACLLATACARAAQPPPASPTPQQQEANLQATITAQQTQTAAQQQQITALQTAVAQKPTAQPAKPAGASAPKTVPTTAPATGRAFIETLVAGEVNAAFALMSASGQSALTSNNVSLERFSTALRPCARSTLEATSAPLPIGGQGISVQFIPPCGSFGEVAAIQGPAPKETVSMRIASCVVHVQAVNDAWRVANAPSCLPSR